MATQDSHQIENGNEGSDKPPPSSKPHPKRHNVELTKKEWAGIAIATLSVATAALTAFSGHASTTDDVVDPSHKTSIESSIAAMAKALRAKANSGKRQDTAESKSAKQQPAQPTDGLTQEMLQRLAMLKARAEQGTQPIYETHIEKADNVIQGSPTFYFDQRGKG